MRTLFFLFASKGSFISHIFNGAKLVDNSLTGEMTMLPVNQVTFQLCMHVLIHIQEPPVCLAWFLQLFALPNRLCCAPFYHGTNPVKVTLPSARLMNLLTLLLLFNSDTSHLDWCPDIVLLLFELYNQLCVNHLLMHMNRRVYTSNEAYIYIVCNLYLTFIVRYLLTNIR